MKHGLVIFEKKLLHISKQISAHVRSDIHVYWRVSLELWFYDSTELCGKPSRRKSSEKNMRDTNTIENIRYQFRVHSHHCSMILYPFPFRTCLKEELGNYQRGSCDISQITSKKNPNYFPT